ncbi:hypothetical protein MLD38_011263 [Melastoma candidum]|uniref:Uncharacterized protein n=1 Tax=Melastoma candidum TaxID=119954 RepID=A0ACB9R5J1_9MYRT|nr:hypothetical protein MLD38_011263 [Melastoma candidum]
MNLFRTSSSSPRFVATPSRKFAAFRVGSRNSTQSLVDMESPPEGYRKDVGICLIKPEKKGGIDDDEDPMVAALRELREETGVVSAELMAEVPFWLTYDFPPDVREKLAIRWGKGWKGQAQKWFLLKFTGKEEEVNLLGDGTEKPEFGDWAWMKPDELIDRAVDFKKTVYQQVFSVFAPHFSDSDS